MASPPARRDAGGRPGRPATSPGRAARSPSGGRSSLPAAGGGARARASPSRRAPCAKGAGARAVELHALAARLLERVWRDRGARAGREGGARPLPRRRARPRDRGRVRGRPARQRGSPGTSRGTRPTTYAELYRAQRRFAPRARGDARRPGEPCRRDLSSSRSRSLAAFRPPARVLEAIDEGLAGEGAIAPALAAARRGRVVARSSRRRSCGSSRGRGRTPRASSCVLDRPGAYRVGDEARGRGTGAADVRRARRRRRRGRRARHAGRRDRLARARRGDDARARGSRSTSTGRAYRRVFYLPEPYRIVIDVARHPPGVEAADAARGRARGDRPGARRQRPGRHRPVGREGEGRHARRRPQRRADARRGRASRSCSRATTTASSRSRSARRARTRSPRTSSSRIHCNASENKARRGVETYVLDTTRDEIAARVAARENATTPGRERRARVDPRRHAPGRPGHALHALRAAPPARGDDVDRRRSTATPSTAACTPRASTCSSARACRASSSRRATSRTPTEEQRLGSADYRQLLADAIANAVKAYREGR